VLDKKPFRAPLGFGDGTTTEASRVARPLMRPLAEFNESGLGAFPVVLVTAMYLLVVVGGWFGYSTTPAPQEAGWFDQPGAAIHLSVVFGMWALLAWALPTMAMSLATGREVFMLPAVEAEPLPNARAFEVLTAEAVLEKYEVIVTDDEFVVFLDDTEDTPVGSILPRNAGPTDEHAVANDDESKAQPATEQDTIAARVVPAEPQLETPNESAAKV
jgi:hypothetical protein